MCVESHDLFFKKSKNVDKLLQKFLLRKAQTLKWLNLGKCPLAEVRGSTAQVSRTEDHMWLTLWLPPG